MGKKKKSTSYSQRVFAAALVAALLFTMPGMASYAEAEGARTEEISESVTVLAEEDAAQETAAETGAVQEPEAEDGDTDQLEAGEDDTKDAETDDKELAEDETVPTQKEDTGECICGTLCTQDSINGDCPVCGGEDADLSLCKGEKEENISEEKKEDAGQEDTGAQDDSANLCVHHKEHTDDCGYSPASEDGEGSPCTYECRICPIEDLIAALPDEVTDGNAEKVRAQLNKILALYRELTAEEQEQIDLSPCWNLQAALDPANKPVTVDEPTEGDVARVEMPDGTTTYVSALAAAFAKENSGATVTLLKSVNLGSEELAIPDDTEFTLEGGTYEITSSSGVTVVLGLRTTFTLLSGTLSNTNALGVAVQLDGANSSFTMFGGTVNGTSTAVSCSTPSVSINISGGAVNGGQMGIDAPTGTVKLSGGTYSSISVNGKTAADILAPGCALQVGDGLISRDTPLSGRQNDVKVVNPCPHTGTLQDKGNGTHGATTEDGTCPYCGTDIAAASHTLGPDNKCKDCKAELKVKVEIGNATTYYGGIDAAWEAARVAESATVTLLDDVTAELPLNVSDGGRIILNGGNNTLSIISFGVIGGQLDITGGIFEMDNGLVVLGGTVHLSGGTFRIGSGGGIGCSAGVASLLLNYGTENTPHYAYFDEAGKPIEMTGQTVLEGTVTVKQCDHTGVSKTSNDNGTHSLKCPYCGYTEAAEDCAYGTEYQHDDTNHWQTCTVCRYENKEPHNWGFDSASSGNVIENHWVCFGCGRTKDHLTLTITVPDVLTYGNTEGKQVTCTVSPETTCDKVRWRFTGGSWPEFPDGVLPADLSVGEHWFRVEGLMSDDTIVFSGSYYLTVAPAPLTGDMVTLSPESTTYSGTEQKPTITVKQGETTLAEGTDYDITYSTTDFTNAGTVIVTIKGKDNYTGTVEKTYTIKKAPLTITASSQAITYGQSITQGIGGVTADGLCSSDSLDSITLTASTANVPGGNITPSAAGIKNSGGDVTGNYEITYVDGKLTISYMKQPENILYNSAAKENYYGGKDVIISAAGYKVSDVQNGEYRDSYTIPVPSQTGTVTKTLYFSKDGGISDGVEITVNFDLTPPTGKITVGAKWWQSFLKVISFGHYKVSENTVTINAEDNGGSGIDRIEYFIAENGTTYDDAEELAGASLNWTVYDNNKPTVPADSPCVIYAKLTDKVGNVTYISTDGILLDNTPPKVENLTVPEDTIKDVTAGFTFTVSEAADYYYVVLPKDSAAPSAENIIVTCGGTLPEGKTGTAINGVTTSGRGAVSEDMLAGGVSVEAGNLSPNTAYTVYVTAVDRALDITSSEKGTPAGNIAVAVNADFTTKKTLPVITKIPTITGTYGQSVGEMTITGGAANGGNSVLTGTWTVSDTDKGKKPAAGTTEAVTVTFTPDNNGYDSVSVNVIPTVNPRSLDADGVTISEVAGTYTYTGSEIKPPVAVNSGTPTSGIYISDTKATLTANDFTVSYSNNTNAGTASVTITGKGNYTGTVRKTFTIGKAPGRTIPDLTGSYTDDGKTYTYTIKSTEGAVYRRGDGGAWTAVNEFKNITPGTSVAFYAKMPENENYREGEAKSITVSFPKLTPAAPALSYKADRTDQDNVKVTITPVEGAEYSFDGGTTWNSGEGANVQGGFDTSQTVILAIRLKETDTHNQSPTQTVTVDLSKKDREAPLAFSLEIEANGETDYTVTIPPTEGCEYSFDGETWSDSNVKTGVKVGETVTGYKRYKETNEYNASNARSDSEQMPRFTVKTPVITPAGGSYTGSVSVTITCGSPDAEIYYTTDGSMPIGSSTRYTRAFTVTAPATVKAIAIKEGLTDSAVATASYTKQGSGGSGGGNSGNTGSTSDGNDSGANNSDANTSDGSGSESENSGDGGQGNSGDNGGGNTASGVPSVPAVTDTNQGTGTETTKPGAGNTAKPGTGTEPESGTAKEERPDTGIPFIKEEDGKIGTAKCGWDVIRAEEEKAEEGSVINVDMNGTTVVPGDIFDSIKGRDITITFDMGNGIIWSVDGRSIITDKTGGIDFSVKTGVNAIPVDILNNVTGESYSIQISLAHEGEFGFTAVLSINLGKENAGYTASLYYYNKSTGELEFICANEVAEDGTVLLTFTHASDYVIALEGDGEENAPESAGSITQSPEGENGGSDGIPASPKEIGEGQESSTLWIILAGVVAVILTAAGILIWKRKKEEGSGEAR